VRQPEVARRLPALALALVLAAPVARDVVSLALSGAFLIEFLTGGSVRMLTAVTPAPVRERLDASADRWRGVALGAPRSLLLVHGYAPAGKNEPRLVRAAALLARAGFDVVVPTLPGLAQGRLRPEDAVPVVRLLASRPGPWAVVSVSIGAAPAFLAAADVSVRDRVRVLLAFGPHGSAFETLRFWLTGRFAFDGVAGYRTHDPALVRAFVDANRELVDDATRAALTAGDTAGVEHALQALSPEVRGLLDRLSPTRAIRDVRARVVLVHGYDDPAVPYTESLRLAAARPARTRLVLLHTVGHVEAAPGPLSRAVRDGIRLLLVFHALRTA
jgi:pimeloyl-ACP methyl ester carboxylesterase